jgi:hypothetical protein
MMAIPQGVLVAKDKDAEVRRVAAELDALLARLEGNVAAMNEILTRPAAPPGDDAQERLVPQ